MKNDPFLSTNNNLTKSFTVLLQLGDQSKIVEDVRNGLSVTQSQLKDAQKQVRFFD